MLPPVFEITHFYGTICISSSEVDSLIVPKLYNLLSIRTVPTGLRN